MKPAPPPAPAQQVLAAAAGRSGARSAAARAPAWPERLRLPRVPAAVNGRQIRRVTFFVDGRRVAVRRGTRNGQRRFTARVTPGRLSLGVHRVTARVVFRTASRTRPRTLVLSFQRCARQAPSPAVHRLMRVWLPAIALAATALAAAPSAASADVRLSTERSVTRWAHANLLAKVRKAPNAKSRTIARLRWQTEDGPPEVYVVLKSRTKQGATWMKIRIPGGRTAAPAGSAASRWAGSTRSTRR